MKGKWEKMSKATAAFFRLFRKKEFDKMLAVADPANGDDFMVEVCSYTNIPKIIIMCLRFFGFNF